MKNTTTLFLSLFFTSLLHADQKSKAIRVVFRQGPLEVIKKNPVKHKNEQQLIEGLLIALQIAQQKGLDEEEKQIAIAEAEAILSTIAENGTIIAREKAFTLAEYYKFKELWNENRSFLNICKNNWEEIALSTPLVIQLAKSSAKGWSTWKDSREAVDAGERSIDPTKLIILPAEPGETIPTLGLREGNVVGITIGETTLGKPTAYQIAAGTATLYGATFNPKKLANKDYSALLPFACALLAATMQWDTPSFAPAWVTIAQSGAKSAIISTSLLSTAYQIYSEMYEPCPFDDWKHNLEKDKEREENLKNAFPVNANLGKTSNLNRTPGSDIPEEGSEE